MGRSSFGRGGMHTKVNVAQQSAKLGIDSFIANGYTPDVLLKLLGGNLACTYFPAGEKKSGLKRWIAYAHGNEATIEINKGAYQALKSNRASSLLPIGIIGFQGSFKKGDLLQINYNDKAIGVGLANYGSNILDKTISKSQQKYLVHYDHLLLY